MNFRDLQNALGIGEDGQLSTETIDLYAETLDDDNFTSNILLPFYGDGALSIGAATLLPGGALYEVAVGGLASLPLSNLAYSGGEGAATDEEAWIHSLNGMNVVARFTLNDTTGEGDDAEGALSVTVEYDFASRQFSDIFPNLAVFVNAQLEDEQQQSALAYLEQDGPLPDASFVLKSVAEADLSAGLNFVGTWSPGSLLGVFQSLVGADESFRFAGPVVLPTQGAEPQSNGESVSYPWDVTPAISGVHLLAELGIEPAFGPMSMVATGIRIYNPLHPDWLVARPDYEPSIAYEGTLVIPSVNTSVTVTATQPPGVEGLLLSGDFHDLSLENLTDAVADLAGGNDTLQIIPEAIQHEIDQIDLQLSSAIVALEPDGDSGYSVTHTAFNIGMALNWSVVADLLVIDINGARVQVDMPFDGSQRAMSASLNGQLQTLGLAFDVHVEVPGFLIQATLTEPTTLSLRDLFIAHFPELPAPPDVTIESVDILANADGDYEFSMSVAAGAGWQLDDATTISSVFASLSSSEWRFEGYKDNDGAGIPVVQLVEKLASDIGVGEVSLPETIRGLEVKAFAAAYDIQAQNFTFTCEADFPLAEDSAAAIVVTIEIVAQGDGTYSKSFGGRITLGARVFGLIFGQSSDDTIIAALYQNADGDTLNIKELVADVSASAADYVPKSLTLTLKEAVFAYSSGDSSKFLFALDLATGLNLSNLPLVGATLPIGQTLGVDDLQLVIASAAFDQADVASLNGLLPEGVTALSDGGVGAGFNISAMMQLGDTVSRLEMPVPNNDESGASTSAAVSDMASATTTAVPVTASADATWYTLERSFGPVSFERVGVQYQNDAIWFLLDASMTAAGLTLSLDGLAMGSPLAYFDPQFNIDGVGIDYEGGAVQLGGAFLRVDSDAGEAYAGAAVLKTAGYSLSAMGSYAPVDGHPSLFAYAMLDQPLGGPSFFFVTGLAAGFGYNQSITMPGIDDVASFPLITEAMNPTLSAADHTAAMGLLQPYLAPAVGASFLMLGVKFNSFKLIDSFALFTFIAGDHPEVQILGLSQLILPTPIPGSDGQATPLAQVKLALLGTIDPEEGIMGIKGQLTSDSYILSKQCRLTGGFAFYSWFKDDPENADGYRAGDFVQTVGGYHPDFDVPAHYPIVPRLAFTWNLDSNTTIEGDAYCALTPHALMAGGSLKATWQSGDLKAYFNAGADLLISWRPYHYTADMHISVGASYKTSVFGVNKTFKADLGCQLHLWGPDFGGKASIDWSIISFDVKFGASEASASAEPISWDTFSASFLPAQPCSIAAGGGLLGTGVESTEAAGDEQDGDGQIWILNPRELSLVTDSFIPTTTDVDYASIGVGSMGLRAGHFEATQVVTLERKSDMPNEDGVYSWSGAASQFLLRALPKVVPAALWQGATTSGEVPQASANGTSLIENALAGYEITSASAAPPDFTAAIPVTDLQFNIDKHSSHYHFEELAPFQTETFTALNEDELDLAKRAVIAETIEAALPLQHEVLTALGLDTSAITVDATVADDFVLAPEIQQVPT